MQSTPGRTVDALDDLSPPLVQFAGQSSGAVPPDTVGDVGPNHYVQMVNTSFQVWDKQGTSLAGPTNINSLWTSNGVNDAECDNQNAGDPIVAYDQAADRWMLSQFTDPGTTPRNICIAYSQTADPTGAYHTYAFLLPRQHDYPKFGIWPDGLYMSTFEGSTLGAYVFDRSSMLNGAAATFQDLASISAGSHFRGQRLLPSDWDGTVGPLLGTPNYFVQSVDGAYDSTTDRLEVFEARVDWQNPANSSFVNVTDLPTLPLSIDTGCTDDDGDGAFRNCVPQAGTTMKVDALANRLMHRLQYRNFRTYEAMVTNQTIDAGSDRHAVRWYELRRAGGSPWMLYQQGTYAPGSAHRWMGSMAMDGRGDIALGYSLSDPTNSVFPSIAYTGRNVDAPRGLMPEPEFTLFSGADAQTAATVGVTTRR
ncbi:MAG: large repetitive protein [Micromonosporaceae bacterium]|nr:large repetitive protein [Micromonosporaceae bacterium]